jgi:hypothetical protein
MHWMPGGQRPREARTKSAMSEREFHFTEEAANDVQGALLGVAFVALITIRLSWDSAQTLGSNLREAAGGLLVLGCLLAALVGLGRDNKVVIAGSQLTYTRYLGPFGRTFRYPLSSVRVSSAVFSFAPWDPHVAIHVPGRTIRVVWGLPASRVEEVVGELEAAIADCRNQ